MITKGSQLLYMHLSFCFAELRVWISLRYDSQSSASTLRRVSINIYVCPYTTQWQTIPITPPEPAGLGGMWIDTLKWMPAFLHQVQKEPTEYKMDVCKSMSCCISQNYKLDIWMYKCTISVKKNVTLQKRGRWHIPITHAKRYFTRCGSNSGFVPNVSLIGGGNFKWISNFIGGHHVDFQRFEDLAAMSFSTTVVLGSLMS
jgi:hypothetical protein